MILLIFLWLCCGFVAAGIERDRGSTGALGCLLGTVFGPIGVIVCLLDDTRPKCPYCRGRIDKEAVICQHCRTRLDGGGEDEDEGEE